MQAAFIVNIQLEDVTDLTSEAEFLQEVLVQNGVSVVSVAAWHRPTAENGMQVSPSGSPPTLADITRAVFAQNNFPQNGN